MCARPGTDSTPPHTYTPTPVCHCRELDSYGLSGVLSPRLAELASLRVVDLSNNQLIGSLPAEWATLRQLRVRGSRMFSTDCMFLGRAGSALLPAAGLLHAQAAAGRCCNAALRRMGAPQGTHVE